MYMYDNELLLLLTMFSLSPRLRSRWSTCHWGLWGWTVSWLSLTPHCPVLAARITDRLALHSSTAHWKYMYHKIIYMYNSSISNMIKVQYYMIFYCFVNIYLLNFLLLIKTLPGTQSIIFSKTSDVYFKAFKHNWNFLIILHTCNFKEIFFSNTLPL